MREDVKSTGVIQQIAAREQPENDGDCSHAAVHGIYSFWTGESVRSRCLYRERCEEPVPQCEAVCRKLEVVVVVVGGETLQDK